MGTVAGLERATGTLAGDWTGDDYEAATVLLGRYDDDQLGTLADDTARAMGFDAVFPAEVLSYTQRSVA